MNEEFLQYDDLAWQAFRYVAGELEGPELEHFEALLAEDQGAREAVAQAVELSQATVVALSSVSSTRRAGSVSSLNTRGNRADGRIGNPSYAKRIAALAATVAACVVVGLGISQWQAQNPPATNPNDALASRWNEVRLEEPADSSFADHDAESIGEDWAIDEDEFATPDWMLAAVEQQASGNMNDMPEPERNSESQEQ